MTNDESVEIILHLCRKLHEGGVFEEHTGMSVVNQLEQHFMHSEHRDERGLRGAGLEYDLVNELANPGLLYYPYKNQPWYEPSTIEIDNGIECEFQGFSQENTELRQRAIQRTIGFEIDKMLNNYLEPYKIVRDISSAGIFPHRNTSMMHFGVGTDFSYLWHGITEMHDFPDIKRIHRCNQDNYEGNVEICNETLKVKAMGLIKYMKWDVAMQDMANLVMDFSGYPIMMRLTCAHNSVVAYNRECKNNIEAAFAYMKLKQDRQGNRTIKFYFLAASV